MKRIMMITTVAAVLAAAACDDNDPAGPGEPRTPVASVVLSPDTATLMVGQSRALQVKAYAAGGAVLEGRTAAWESSDTTVLAVDSAGHATALSAGLAIVTAEVEGKAGNATLRVQAPVVPVASVHVGPEQTITLTAGATLQLSATTHAADGTELPDRAVTWTSDRESVATVDASGKLEAHAEGIALITATSEGRSGHAQVTVEAPAPTPPVASVRVRPSLVVTYVGAEAPLRATLEAEDGTVLTGRPITWTSSDPSVATVSAEGVVVGRAGGTAVITATVEGESATVVASLKTTSSYHLAYDRDESAFSWMDMRTGIARKAMTHAGGVRSIDPSPSPTRSGFAKTYDNGPGTPSWIMIESWSNTTYMPLASGDQPAWSPDGARVAFRGRDDGRADIWSIHADGSTAAVNLTADLPEGVQSERPAWSPTGDRIVFAASNARGGTDLWIMNADGTGKRTLTQGPFRDSEPTWFGDRIVFTRRTELGTSDLYWTWVNGALVQRLTTMGGAQMPAWSPDGAWIAFVVRDGETGLGDVMALRPDGSDVRPLSLRSDGPDGGGLNPAWTLHW